MRDFWARITEAVHRRRIIGMILDLVLLILGIFLVIRPGAAIRLICMLIGIAMLVCGIFLTVDYISAILSDSILKPLPYRIVSGIFLIVIGLLITIHPEGIITFAGVVLAIILLTFSIMSFYAMHLFQVFGDSRWWVQLISSLITLVLALVLIFAPIESAEFVMRLAGIGMIYTAVYMLVANVRLQKYGRDRQDSDHLFHGFHHGSRADESDTIDGEAREIHDEEEHKSSFDSDSDSEILEGEVVDEDEEGDEDPFS